MAPPVSVSVVLPAYNESPTITSAVEDTLNHLKNFLPAGSYELIIAEDGCTDNTPKIASDLAIKHDEVRHYHSPSRLGRGEALNRAFEIAKGDTLVYLDSDLATDNVHLEQLITAVHSGSADIATGSRWFPGAQTKRPFHRSILSKGFNTLVRFLLRSKLYDHQCGFKAFNREIFFKLSPSLKDTHWFWDTEILVKAQNSNFNVFEFPVSWTPQKDTKVDIARDVFAMAINILRLWIEFYISPRITALNSSVFGFFISFLALFLMGYYLDLDLNLFYTFMSNPIYLLLSIFIYLLSWPIRGIRYQKILSQLGFQEPLKFLTESIFLSQTCNLVVPARAGDAARAYILKSKKKIPYVSGFASLFFERLFDLLTITTLAGVVFILTSLLGSGSLSSLDIAVGNISQSGEIAIQLAIFVAISVLFLLTLILISSKTKGNRISRLLKIFSNDLYAQRFSSSLEHFVENIQKLTINPAIFVRVGVLSLIIWSLDVFVAIIILYSFDPFISLPTLIFTCFFAVSIGNLAKVLPLSPGGIGLYEGAFTLLVVSLAGVSPSLALSVAIIDHAIKNFITILGGSISSLDLNLSLKSTLQGK